MINPHQICQAEFNLLEIDIILFQAELSTVNTTSSRNSNNYTRERLTRKSSKGFKGWFPPKKKGKGKNKETTLAENVNRNSSLPEVCSLFSCNHFSQDPGNQFVPTH